MNKRTVLILGDIFAIAVITVIGFATHGEAEISLVPRMLTTFIPLTVSWFLIAPWLGLFVPGITGSLKMLWRVPLAVIFAGPLAALLRALLLNSVVIPVFGVVLSGSAALGMLVWRVLYYFLFQKR